jgi:two-component system, cell cycle response regulator
MSAARIRDPFAAHRAARAVAGALLVGAVAAHVIHAATAGPDTFFTQWLYDAVVLAAAAACLARGALVREDRAAWLVLGVGLLSWAAGEIYWSAALAGLDDPPYPSPADALYLLFYPCAYVAVALLVSRRREHRTGRWLDGLVAALAVSALGSALVLPPIVADSTGSTAAIATNLAYPLGDLLVLAFLAGGMVVTAGGRGPGPTGRAGTASGAYDRGLVLLAAGLAVSAVADCIYLYLVATDAYVEGTVLDSAWLVAVALMAFAAWQRPRARRAFSARRGSPLPVPIACATVAVGLGAYGTLHGMPTLAALLTIATLAAVVLRLALTLRENARMLSASRAEATTDVLTNLPNRRQLVRDLEGALADREPATFALFDLDGFKTYNDTFGHPAGDALLWRLAARLDRAARGAGGTAYRMGGDEFCLLLPSTGAAAEAAVRNAHEALVERSERFVVTSSYGVVALPDEADTPSDALRRADHRMYARKASRRGSARLQSHAVLLQVLEEAEPDLGEHLRGVTYLSVEVARALGLDAEAVDEVARAAQLHDVGKVAVPDDILRKPGPLDDDDWRFVREHTIVGQRILAAAPALAPVGRIVRATHERWDGRGYPDGLGGDAIPLGARIISVCDAYDAMTTDRPYRRAMPAELAIAELRASAGTQFDPVVVETFVSTLRSPRRTMRVASPSDASSAATTSEIWTDTIPSSLQ